MTGIQRWLPIFVEAKGYYLLPAVAGILVAARYVLVRTGRERFMRPVFVGLTATALFSVLVYFNFFNYHYGGFVNAHEFFHYYLGSKYAPEVGYTELYNAALVADAETGLLFRPVDGHIRDLTNYGERSVSDVLAERDAIKSRFSPERWRVFVQDVSYFKHRLGGPQWREVLRDQGYNATPVWTMLVRTTLSERVPTDSASGMNFLALLDVVLLAAALGTVAWTFGTWTGLLMMVFLASSYLMAHVHMKGAFLRTDFVVALVVAMCLLRKGRHGWAGALVGYAALARVFPAIFLFGPGVKLAEALGPVAGEARRRIGGTARATALLAAAAATAAGALVLVWLGIGSGLRELLASRFGDPAGLLVVAVVPATAVLAAVALTVWGTRQGLLDRRHARFFGGFAITTVVLLGASLLYAGSFADWEGFARKMALHRTTYNFWNIGVTSVVIAQFDPPGPREAALALRPPLLRSWLGNAFFFDETVREKAWLIHGLQLLALVAAWHASRRFDDDLAFTFGFVMTYFLTAPTYYYYIILFLPFLYFAAHPDRLSGTLGLLYLFLFGALGFAFYFRWDQYFTTYYWNCVLALGVTIAMVATAYGRFTPWSPAPKAARKR